MTKLSLMALAPELRLIVWEHLFRETVIDYGASLPKQQGPLAILLTCRQIYKEAKEYVHANVTLRFESTDIMMQKIRPMPTKEQARFRHVQVSTCPAPRNGAPSDRSSAIYGFVEVVAMLPGLQLDTLVLEDMYQDFDDDSGTYVEVSALIRSSGWRRLLFYSPSCTYLTWDDTPHLQREDQPGAWQQQLAAFAGDHEPESSSSQLLPVHKKYTGPGQLRPHKQQQSGGSVILLRAKAKHMGFQAGEANGVLWDTIRNSSAWEQFTQVKAAGSAAGSGRDEQDMPSVLMAERGADWPICKQTGHQRSNVVRNIFEAYNGV